MKYEKHLIKNMSEVIYIRNILFFTNKKSLYFFIFFKYRELNVVFLQLMFYYTYFNSA